MASNAATEGVVASNSPASPSDMTDSANPPRKVVLRVPATTANLGPAYDVLGMALSMFMEVTVEHADTFSVHNEGEGAENISVGEDNLIVQTCRLAFEKYAKCKMPTLKFTLKSNIPFGCGCGSSSAAAVAGFVAGMMLSGITMETSSREELLAIIAEVEGHPDNAAPAIYGGCQLGYKNDAGNYMTYRVPIPSNLSVVLFIPAEKMKKSTHETRGLVPTTVPLTDCVHNLSRTAIVVLAFSTGNLRLLKDCMEEKLHQNVRANAMFPHFSGCVKAAMDSGADYAFLSGAGPAICAFVSGRRGDLLTQPQQERAAEAVADAMVEAAAAAGVKGRAIITQPSDIGAHMTGMHRVKSHIQYISI